MKDEIKEILEFDFQSQGERIEINEYERDILKDYITNLQEENEYSNYCNEQLRKKIVNLKYKIEKAEEENEELKEKIENLTTMTVCGDRKQIKNTAQYKLDIYKSRIDKAIHIIQLLQMDNEVTVKDLGLIARYLTGGDE